MKQIKRKGFQFSHRERNDRRHFNIWWGGCDKNCLFLF